ncbi:Hexamerin [Dufourea novaeangliae]|uniref:Hexamerin n=1 Tax=Dufourea novaeangliae TaxID=178035 RepID=A0A154P7X3_DUFNO|nr:Hexamerin [Dufourea novaeangliae]
MKSIILCVLASLCVFAQSAHLPTQTADNVFLTKQKNIYELFWHVDQPNVYFPKLIHKARGFNIAENVKNYADQEAITEFLELLKTGMLPRGEIFTQLNPTMRHQANILFRVLYSATTFDIFYSTAIWARFNVNEMMYILSLSTAVLLRPDTRYMKMPPLYEVMPHLYFTSETMQKAYSIAMGDVADVTRTSGGVDYFILPTNYSTWYQNKEHELSYLTEDIGLNAFYFLVNNEFPTQVSSEMMPQSKLFGSRGEFYFFVHKQLLNRYLLERLTNGLNEIEYISMHQPIVTGYNPIMHLPNGLPLAHRDVDAVVPRNMQKHLQHLQEMHNRISVAIDVGYVLDTKGNRINIYTPDGLNILGNIVQGNADSINPRLYGSIDMLARKIFGFGVESNMKYEVVPSVLDYLSTSLRDPVFYGIYQNILTYFHRYKENLPKYTREKLLFTGVEIQSVSVDKMMTYFDTFETMLNNGLSIRNQKEAEGMLIMARQHRLNHKPFTYNIVLNSKITTQATVRIFMGPKFDVHGNVLELENNYMNFLELDQFMVNLKVGTNNIERSSHQSIYVVPDEIPSHVFYKNVVNSIDGSSTFSYRTHPYGFPDRLILPKGKSEGMPFKLFVAVTPVDSSKLITEESPIFGQLTMDGHPMGYPLDRPIDPLHFHVPNMMLTDVLVYHKELEQLNVTA